LTKESIPVRTTFLVLLLAALWGGNVVAIKIGLRGIPPLAAAGIRFSVALPLITLWARLRHVSLKPRAGEIIPLLVVGLIFTTQITLLNWGTRMTLAGRATVILHTYPVFVAFLAHFMIPGDRLSWTRLIGVICAFAGIVAVFWEKLAIGTGGTVSGDLLCLGSGFLLGLLTVLIKRYVQTIEEARLLVWEMIIAVPLFFVLHALFDGGSTFEFSQDVVAALLYQGVVVGVFCFLTWFSILKRHSPSRLTVLFFTAPLWGLLASYLLLGEGISVGLAIGAAMVALGIFLVNRG
jgi:drug/metabolite transporter (DMT)-like permease